MTKLYVNEIAPRDAAFITAPNLKVAGSTVQTQANNLIARYSQSIPALVWTALTDFSIDITPKYSNSKFLIMVRWNGEHSVYGNVYNSIFGLQRNGTQIGNQSDPSGTTMNGLATSSLSYEGSDANSTLETMNLFYYDNPGVTAGTTLTYRVSFLTETTETLYTNRTVGWTGQSQGYELATSGIVVQEIAQ